MYKLIWLVPLLPLAGAAFNGLVARVLRLGERVTGGVAVGSVALAFLVSLLVVYSYGFSSNPKWPDTYVTSDDGAFVYSWIPDPGAETGVPPDSSRAISPQAPGARPHRSGIEWSYQLDPLSAVFILFITGVGLAIFVFALGYMHGDAGVGRFFTYLCLFMFAMLVLVLGSNLLMTFVGWEGVGLCSYLLIGYYFDRPAANDAARKAFITNRIGDAGFLLAILGIATTFGNTQFVDVVAGASNLPVESFGMWGLMSWLALGLLVGALGKSAQLPLSVWLPDAMAGPTPVSALIHAATMVTAGVYLLARANIIFQHSPTMMFVVAVVGALTAAYAAAIAITQHDIKKVLAYSTISQLGLMFLACGVGAFAAGIFHVVTHAFFKALLFLGAGSVIQAMHHEQDLRRMGGLRKYLPRTYAPFVVGSLAICGIFPLSGFWSKDEILWHVASAGSTPASWFLWGAGILVTIGTPFYMTRLVALAFWGSERFARTHAGGEADEAHAHAFDLGLQPHDARLESAGDRRPFHEPGAFVGSVRDERVAHHLDSPRGTAPSGTVIHGEHVPRESPPVMWAPLMALAVLAFFGGAIGIGAPFRAADESRAGTHRYPLSSWLAPVIWRAESQSPVIAPSPAADRSGPPGEASSISGSSPAGAVETVLGSRERAEWLSVLISLAAALFGIGLGWLFYVRAPGMAAVWPARLGPLYRIVYQKFWLDEIYGALFTRRVADASRVVHEIDAKVIDGAVNGASTSTRGLSIGTNGYDVYLIDGLVNSVAGFIKRLMSPVLRAAQTGLIQNYALVMIFGLLIVVAFCFGGAILSGLRSIFALALG